MGKRDIKKLLITDQIYKIGGNKMKLFIYCCGGLGREIYELAKTINISNKKWETIEFIDDKFSGETVNRAKVYSLEEVMKNNNENEYEVVIASGEPFLKEKIYNNLKEKKIKLAILIHPKIHVSEFVKIGEGSILTEGTIMTTNINIGKCVLVNINCTLGHDVKISDFSTVSPNCNLSGNVTINEMTYIGTATSVRDEVTIGSQSIVGIGSIVTKNIESGVVAYGNPAKVVKENANKRVFK